ncbi:ICP22 family protein [Streptomyces lancefieldiae]|uniref:Uncharacterized protein n=1 Tax=Streptomyces lancefieldiae TaxID=3075520 RepID=A0ABU3AQ38_9ACTN|nr:hypothetical protein [Streptomyces sp. DSM 40712]MDT0612307.1 hypothetical protein [Streptomyces sp. DSM 40712]
MREKPDAVDDADVRTEGESKRIDLSVPQVAGSALAAVVAAKLASSFGVYGTILGAGLISVIATCGSTVLQHFFKRTGEQLRVRRTAEAQVGAEHPGGRGAPLPGEFTEGTVYRARTRGWKRPVVAAALVFGVTMAGITTYELASGHSLSGDRSTTVGNALTGHHEPASDSGDSDHPSDPDGGGDSQDSGDTGESGDSGSGRDTPAATPSGTSGPTADSTPSGGSSEQDGGTAVSPTPTPDATGGEGPGETTGPGTDPSATTPEPGASGRSGTGDPGQDGPAAP